jgi:hypothetical protein
MSDFYLTGNATADRLLADDPNAVLLGMVLDQQVTMEKAFTGPAVIAERMGGRLDVAAIASADPEEFAALCAKPPSTMYASAKTGQELKRLIAALPGFGEQKASIFVALLGKRFGVRPPGWEEAAGGYGRPGTFVSVADISDPGSLQMVREAKRLAKAQAKAARG